MRTLLALPALVAMLLAGTVAEASIATSTFNNANLDPSTQLTDINESLYTTTVFGFTVPNPLGFQAAVDSQGLSSFSVVPTGSNSIPAGDSISFSSTGTKYFRGTNNPGSIPNLVTLLTTAAPTEHTITFNSSNPISEIVLSVSSLKDSRTFTFTGGSAGNPDYATGDLTHALNSDTVGSSLTGSAGNSATGDIVWIFDTPLMNPTIEFEFNSPWNTQVHFSGVSYVTVAAVPEPMSFVWFAGTLGMVQFGFRRRIDAD
ncbi:hypothetical protein [Botrimarina mediterranea]|uniref:PEP-CTERM protein-sorting domain-containing protein n=1 Tax=Botrimarina mediterranea TaxID=2528022 RepID=A0A518KAY5_9BACT|nr:hypothetical protein [Botrimarina mediterranea]QDV74954.1 hypothetical protein Spa11_31630 [Botrimarina mediterranea]QDV79599.1 hypothetical protein K2D_32140 [Planctomycetes bacterium K2D]